MKRYMGVLVLLAVLTAGCSGHNDQAVTKQHEASHAQTEVIAQSQDQSVRVKANTSVTGDMLQGLTVQIGEQERSFPWSNVSNPTYYPEVRLANVDADAESEVLIILTTAYGTGVRQAELHVLNKDFTELDVDNPTDAVKSHIRTSHAIAGDKHTYSVTVDNHTYTKSYSKAEAGQWFEDVVIGNITTYRVQGQSIVVELSAQVSPGTFMGTVVAEYEVRGDRLAIGRVAFREGD
ncbi:hypothetical protein [Paenibacillus sp. YYML68]|uniref:hypothetical protein n=1 Tax=Paenibacillus sp. YYML68 TaxID=2909250 RepID=UPI0024911A1C|nr:hypothetical protein [Paenibacillus sp. YYML68]